MEQRFFEKAPQGPAAHGRFGFIEHPEKAAPFFLSAQRLCQLQVTPGGQIQLHKFTGQIKVKVTDMTEVVFLHIFQGFQERAGGNQHGRQGRSALGDVVKLCVNGLPAGIDFKKRRIAGLPAAMKPLVEGFGKGGGVGHGPTEKQL